MSRKSKGSAGKTKPVRMPVSSESEDDTDEDTSEESSDDPCAPSTSSKKATQRSKSSAKQKVSKKANVSRGSNKLQKDLEMMTPSKKKVHEAEINKLVHDLVYYLFLCQETKYAIKKTDILKHVFGDGNKKLYPIVYQRAQVMLKKKFGVKIVELPEKKSYFLVNSNRDIQLCQYSETEAAFRGLLQYILSAIFMNEDSISEADLWKTLELMDVDVENPKPHPVFGDIRKHVTQELVKQLYIIHRKVSEDPIEYEFVWGPRAIHEVNKEEMLNFVAEMYGDEPQEWVYQYQQVQKELNAAS